MITVAVASGKGGAGKTSLTAALAATLAPECVVADCDVDAANTAIALGASVDERSAYFAGTGYFVDQAACVACGACASSCRFDAIRPSKDGTAWEIIPELCERCGACFDRCPTKAIVASEKEAGELLVSSTRLGITLVHAELVPGEDTSGKLVRKVRDRARDLAAVRPGSSDSIVVLADAPPGIGCPVIASLSGCDLVVAVVEASVSGVKDAARLLELAKAMNRRAVGIVNKAGLDGNLDAKARSLLEGAGIPLAGVIPFDTSFRSVEEAGKTWLGVEGPAGDKLRDALGAVVGTITELRPGA